MLSLAIVLLAFLSLVSGFVTNNNHAVRSRSLLSMATETTPTQFSKSVPFLKKPKNLDGYVGNVDFDPFGLAELVDPRWMVESELKHGRIAMLAVVGWLVQAQGIHLPSPDGLYDVSNPIDAFFHVGPSPILQIFAGIGALESINHNGKLSVNDMFENSDRPIGQFSLPIYGANLLKGKTPAQIADIKLKEVKNGRLAMIAIGGLVHQQIVAGSDAFGSFPNPACGPCIKCAESFIQ